MSQLIGKRIECHLETATGDKTKFIADVRKGRGEGEVHLTPVGDAPVPAGYCPTNIIYVHKFIETEKPAAALTPEVVPENPVLPSGFVASPEPPALPVDPEKEHEERKLSQNPTKFHSARSAAARKGAADHGAAAAQPDEFQQP